MKQNKYDDELFFEKYSHMDRSEKGLAGAGEWHVLQQMLPSFQGKRVLDLGCGFGWHCIYAMEQGAQSAVGIDLSEKMLEEARRKTAFPQVTYRQAAMEDVDFPDGSFDVILSSLALHYVDDFAELARKIFRWLSPGGSLVFSVEHPIFTAYGNQDWYRDADGTPLHWPVDRYFTEGRREAVFLGEPVVKYHKTLTTYLHGLLRAGLVITDVQEPTPSQQMLDTIPGMADELRRPMMLLVSAYKPV